MNHKCKEASLQSQNRHISLWNIMRKSELLHLQFWLLTHNNDMTLHIPAAWCNGNENHVKDDFKMIKFTLVRWFPASSDLLGYGGVVGSRVLVSSRSLDLLALPPATVFTTRSFSQFVLTAITGKLKSDQQASQPARVSVHSVALL